MRTHPILAIACAAFATLNPSGARGGTAAQATDSTLARAAREDTLIELPTSKLAREAAQMVRSAEGEMLFQHSMRVYFWAALAGKRKGLVFDPDLLFVAAMFHDYGLTIGYCESRQRYEVDGADAARAFLRGHGIAPMEAEKVWLAIALHTTNGISPHLFPVASLLAEAASMDLVGAGFADFTPAERQAVEAAHRREPGFAEDFMQALYESLKHRPETTQGTGLADVMAYKDPSFPLRNFSHLMLNSPWEPQKATIAPRENVLQAEVQKGEHR
jgi:HD superfamily phosphodiesterase